MIKKISMMVVATLIVTFMCADIGLAATSKLGDVLFIHSQNYSGLKPTPIINGQPTYERHRLWLYLAEARHWDPKGNLKTIWFRHEPGGPERIRFVNQLPGKSHGDTRILVGVVCKPSKCYSRDYRYVVIANKTICVYPTTKHRR